MHCFTACTLNDQSWPIIFVYFRGMFGGSGALSVSAGITLVYTLGATLPNWRWVCVTCGAIPIAIFLLMPMLPETPNWLIMKGKRDEAYEVTTIVVLESHLHFYHNLDT